MADDLAELRQEFEQDLDEWAEAREERAIDLRYLAGDTWTEEAKNLRDAAERPYLCLDELSQYVNQIVNEFSANPLSVQFAPTGAGTSEKVAQFYADKMREIEYRSHAQLAYTNAGECAVQGGYGFVRVASEYVDGSVDQQELVIKAVMDPNTIVPDPRFQRPDLSDMRRCAELQWVPIDQFKHDYPKAKIRNFESYQTDADYTKWIKDDRILLMGRWRVLNEPTKLLKVQLPVVAPPPSQFGFRPAVQPPPQDIREADWPTFQARGAKVIGERDGTTPKVTQQLVNGVEILKETTWPGPYIPIAGCLGRILYLDNGGTSKRIILSAIRLARDPAQAYNFYRTSEMENVGRTTKNPYWAYDGQITPEQQIEIAKSLHEPVAVLFAKAITEATGANILPLPKSNTDEPAIQAVSMAAEEMRRAVQSAMASNFLPTSAGRQNEKSGVALQEIELARKKGSAHFNNHYLMMLRHVGAICEVAIPAFYDTARQVMVRRGDDTTAQVWVNNPSQPESIDPTGHYAVTVSSGPSMDSTREAASDFADNLLASAPLMQLLGPQKAQQIVALAIKLKVKQTGIGAIGDQIVDIIAPPSEDDQLTPEQLKQKVAQMGQQLEQAKQILQQAAQERETKAVEQQGKLAVTQVQEAAETARNRENNETKLAVAELGAKVERLTLFLEERARLGAERHEVGLAAADAAEADRMDRRQHLANIATQAQPGEPMQPEA